MMATIMDKRSIPSDYDKTLKQYASHGFRVLAIASKPISEGQMKTISRSDAESQLIFNGFEVFENKLKP
jgi:magnesium-transporting ATPase (P-type)